MNDQRPTDELTADVVAKWKDWNDSSNFAYVQHSKNYYLYGSPSDGVRVFDPRDDSDAAMELLHWVCIKTDWTLMAFPDTWDLFDGTEAMHIIPASGQHFRYAVVNLAAKVMGLEESNESLVSGDQSYD